jgi:hypothetical protein
MDLHWRVSVNAFVQPLDLIFVGGFLNEKVWTKVLPVYFPVMWGGQDSNVTDSQADEFKSQVYTTLKWFSAVYYGGIALASASGLAFIVLVVLAERRRRSLLPPDYVSINASDVDAGHRGRKRSSNAIPFFGGGSAGVPGVTPGVDAEGFQKLLPGQRENSGEDLVYEVHESALQDATAPY